jgi:mono/diheme cytochrome c family protein
MKPFLYGVVATLFVLIVGGYFYLTGGHVNIAADQRPGFFERRLAMRAMDAAVERRAPDLKNPVPPTEENLVSGAKLYMDHCAGCHGVPSNPASEFSRSFNPPVPNFFKRAPDMPDHQNFYITQHGIRWTGMPAWSGILTDDQIWKIVTFMSQIEKLPPAAKKVLEPTEASATPTAPQAH